MSIEFACKKIRKYLENNHLDAMLLGRRSSFAWFSGGESSMNFYTDMGLGFIWISKDDAFVYCSNNEQQRISYEIFANKFPIKSFSWVEGPGSNLQKLILEQKVVSDFSVANTQEDYENIKKLRYQLSSEQNKLAYSLSKKSAEMLENCLKKLKIGMSEIQIQAEIRYAFEKEGIALPVLLVAGDENLNNYRHPLATNKSVNEKIMVVICSQYKGVMIATSRIRYFRPETQQEKIKNLAVAKINADMICVSKEEVHSSKLWETMLQAYSNHGFAQEYLNHHQGGAIGFESREWILRPTIEETLLLDQLVAWNPTLVGAKSEETILITSSIPEVLTVTGEYPTLTHNGITVTLPLV